MRSDRPDAQKTPDDGMPASLRRLRQMWKIPDTRPPREMPPAEVAHDIYRVPDHKPTIPHRPPERRRRAGGGETPLSPF
jgi:hypothetical protein